MKFLGSSLVRGFKTAKNDDKPTEIMIPKDKGNQNDTIKQSHHQEKAIIHRNQAAAKANRSPAESSKKTLPSWRKASKMLKYTKLTKFNFSPRASSTQSEVSSVTMQTTCPKLKIDDADLLSKQSTGKKHSTLNRDKTMSTLIAKYNEGFQSMQLRLDQNGVLNDYALMINQARAKNDIPPLIRSLVLDEIATDLVENSARSGYCGSIHPFHYQGHVLRGSSVEQILTQLQQSENAALDNILNENFQDIGIACCESQNGILYLCQLFDSDSKTRAEF